jgi:tetratricopeptide (TPR) repeat protein
MAADFRQFDEHGFPLPPRFSDLKYHDDEPVRPKLSPKARQYAVLAMVVVVLGLLFGPRLIGSAREIAADWLSTRAAQKYFRNNFAGALSDLNWAVDLNPNRWDYYQLRAAVRMELNDLNGSLADHTRWIELLESPDAAKYGEVARASPRELLANAYSQRSWINMRLQRGQDAVDDATMALTYDRSPEFFNGRAYVKALAEIDLEGGLADVDKAIAQQGKEDPNFLDTRGYLLHLLGKNDDALKDLDNAIQLLADKQFAERGMKMPRNFELTEREMRHALAVMYHHRGEIYGKLNQPEKAAEDIKRGQDFGYDPERGVF